MTFFHRTITLLVLMLILLSCDQTAKDRQLSKHNSASSLNEIFITQNFLNKNSDPLLLGNKFRITHDSYGCFHSNSSYIEVQENNGSYIVTLKDQLSTRAYPPIRFDSSFAIALKDFSNYYSQLLDVKDKIKSKNETIGTVNKLTINGGFRTTIIFCDNISELSGYNNLVNRINLAIAQ